MLHNQILEEVQSAKYLGVTITDSLDWGQHISEISSKVNPWIYPLKPLLCTSRNQGPSGHMTFMQRRINVDATS